MKRESLVEIGLKPMMAMTKELRTKNGYVDEWYPKGVNMYKSQENLCERPGVARRLRLARDHQYVRSESKKNENQRKWIKINWSCVHQLNKVFWCYQECVIEHFSRVSLDNMSPEVFCDFSSNDLHTIAERKSMITSARFQFILQESCAFQFDPCINKDYNNKTNCMIMQYRVCNIMFKNMLIQ